MEASSVFGPADEQHAAVVMVLGPYCATMAAATILMAKLLATAIFCYWEALHSVLGRPR